MKIKKYHYTSVDGDHWPDADVGDELYYAIDFSCYLHKEEDELTGVNWVTDPSSGVSVLDNFTSGTQAYIKIKAIRPGSYKFVAHIETIENSLTQVNAMPMMLRVY